jgi:LysM repeat protein
MGVRAPSLKRSLGIAAVGSSLAFAVALSACGDDGGTTQPSIIIQPSTFSTIVSTTGPAAAAPAGGGSAGQTVAGTQVYEVQSNDFLSGIADDYGIPPESIANFNQWDDGVEHMLHPGDVINIPPGAQAPATGDEADSSSNDESADTEAAQEEVDPDDPPRCADGSRQGTYTIVAGDIPAQVAESLDVTVDQLNEANANTPGYSAFIVGADILVPCGDEG